MPERMPPLSADVTFWSGISTTPSSSCGVGLGLSRCRSSSSIVSMATGAMMNTVRIMARPFMTMAGGTCCTPRALRTRLVTTTIFT